MGEVDDQALARAQALARSLGQDIRPDAFVANPPKTQAEMDDVLTRLQRNDANDVDQIARKHGTHWTRKQIEKLMDGIAGSDNGLGGKTDDELSDAEKRTLDTLGTHLERLDERQVDQNYGLEAGKIGKGAAVNTPMSAAPDASELGAGLGAEVDKGPVLRIVITPNRGPSAEAGPSPAPLEVTDPWANIADEPGVESDLVVLARAKKKQAAEDWLDQVAPDTAAPPPERRKHRAKEPAAEPTDPAAAEMPAAPSPEPVAARLQPVVPAAPPVAAPAAAEPAAPAAGWITRDLVPGAVKPGRTAADTARAVTKDIARGATEIPRQVLGGVRDATQSAIHLADWIVDHSPNAMTADAIAKLMGEQPLPKGQALTLPTVKGATTVTGGAVRGVSQFLTGFVAAGGAIGGTASVVRAAVAGGLADFVAFDAHEQRLSNLIQEIPALANPVTAFMAAKPGDNEVEGRLKRAIEGLGLGMLAEGVFRGIRYVRDAKRAAHAADSQATAAREAAKPEEARPLTLLGDETAPASGRADVAQQPSKTASATPDAAAPAATSKTAAPGKAAPAAPLSHEMGVPEDVVARALTDKGLTPLTGGPQPVFVNFARLQTSDDVKRVIADTTAAFAEDIKAAQRGVQTHKQTAMLAAREDAWKLIQDRRTGEPFNAAESLAVRRLWEGSADKLVEVAEVAATNPTAENLVQFRKMLAIHADIQTHALAGRTETARALNAWAIPVGSSTAARLKGIENLLATYGGPEASALLARKVAALKNLPEGAQVLEDVVKKGAMAKTMDVAKEVWVNALLSNPPTHIVNIMGNTIGLAQELIERAATAGWSRAIGSGEVMPAEAVAKMFALPSSIREGWWLMGKALKTGESQFGAMSTKTADLGFERAISAEHLDVGTGIIGRAYNSVGRRSGTTLLGPSAEENWAGKAVDAMGAVVNLPVRFLTAEDDFFKAVAYRGEVAARAVRTASREVESGAIPKDAMPARVAELMREPPEALNLASVDYARYQTYTQDPGRFAAAINRFDRSLTANQQNDPGGHIGSLFLRMLVPFRNTPSNLVGYAFERTPLAPLMLRYREAIARGGADADIARTRMALGTMTLLGVMDLALDGHITGGGPRYQEGKERGTRDTLLRSGWLPYSLKLPTPDGKFRYVSFQRTDPFGMTLGIAADIAEIINNATLDEDKQDQVWRLTAAAAATFANQVLDKNYMQSASEFVDVLHNPDKASTWVNRRIAAFEPAIVGQIRRVMDPAMRYTADLADEIKNRTPGLSTDLPQRRDVWGRPMTFESGMGKLYDAISPIRSKKFDPLPIDKEAIANDFNLAPPTPALSFGIGQSVSLRNQPEAMSRFLELRGQVKPSDMGAPELAKKSIKLGMPAYGDVPLLELVNAIVQGKHALSPAYEAAGPGRNGGKDRMITKIVGDYGRAAKWRLVTEFPALQRILDDKQDRINP